MQVHLSDTYIDIRLFLNSNSNYSRKKIHKDIKNARLLLLGHNIDSGIKKF